MGLVSRGKRSKGLIGGTVALLLFLQAAPSFGAVDFITEIDSTVVSMHDYSVLSGQIKSTNAASSIQKINSLMNKQLGVIRSDITTLDADLNKSWTYLGTTPNFKFPARDVMRQFDLEVFNWYNLELKIQGQVLSCYDKASTSKQCVLKVRAKNSAAELKLYQKITDTLKQIEIWRKAAGR